MIVGGHAQAISGTLSGPEGTGIYVNDDGNQDGKGTSLRTSHWEPLRTVQANGQPTLVILGEPANIIDTVYSESPKPLVVGYIPLETPTGVTAFRTEPRPSTSPGKPAFVIRDAVGSPTTVTGSPFAAGSTTVATATALGKFVYAANYGSNNISGYRIDPATGGLTAITGSPYAVGVNPFAAVVDPSGRLLYVANYGGSSISAFTIDPITGVLSAIPGSPFITRDAPSGLDVSPSGRLLFASTASGFLHVYVIDPPTGGLTPVTGSPFTAGVNPRAVAVESKGIFVYVANAGSTPANGGVAAFRIGQTGALTPVAGSPFSAGAQPSYVAIDPTGQFAYVSNFQSDSVSAFKINAATGALTTVAGSPYAVPAGPFAVAVEPTGATVYAASQGTNPGFISAFSIEPASGALAQLPGSPFPGGGGPARLSFASITPFVATSVPAPTLTQLAPSAAKPGAAVTVVTVFGTNFVPASVVRWNGVARLTVFESPTQLNVAIPVGDLAQAGTASITVANPGPGGGTSSSLNFTINASLALPFVTGAGTLNDAGFTIGQAVAPGSIATSFGTALATGTSALTSPPSATVLGSSMKIDSRVTPLFFVSAGQVAFQVPWEVSGQQRAFATFSSASGTSTPATISVAEFAPGIFTMNAAGVGAVVINATGELTAAAGTVPGIANRPAPRGDFISIYCTGLGDVTNRPATGAPASLDANSLSRTIAAPSVKIGGVDATPVFSGLAPGFVGLYQIVVQVPANTPTGGSIPLTVSIGGQNSNTVTVAVQ